MRDILIIGGGGREHAIGWALSKHSGAGKHKIFAPGNAGTASLPNSENVAVKAEDVAALVKLAEERQPELIIVGPEVPLALGLADQLRERGFLVVGPGAAGAQIEGSKAWAKEFMARHGIPTAAQHTFTAIDEVLSYLESAPAPYVLKADGLAAGKGVLVTESLDEAQAFAREVMEERVFGESGARLLVEEFMRGPEVSALAFCDTVSSTILPLEPACDYKRVGEGDTGLNTGGMGVYSPTKLMTPELRAQVLEEILLPTLRGLQAEGIDYRGILYAGLMLTENGPRVVEFNCRFGDPETQVLLPRLRSDLLEILTKMAQGRLNHAPPLEWDERVCVGVVIAAAGYPGAYKKGLPVSGLLPQEEGAELFHAGTILDKAGNSITNGGRVFNVIAMDTTITLARQKVYNMISAGVGAFEGSFFRRDIAEREESL